VLDFATQFVDQTNLQHSAAPFVHEQFSGQTYIGAPRSFNVPPTTIRPAEKAQIHRVEGKTTLSSEQRYADPSLPTTDALAERVLADRDTRIMLLVQKYESKLEREGAARLAILTRRLRSQSPHVSETEVLAINEAVSELTIIESKIDEISKSLHA
jgi:hypothetical protein